MPILITEIQVVLTRTVDCKPIVTLRTVPGPDTDLTPDQLRALAAAFLSAADDCEAQRMDRKHFTPKIKTYVL